jgi:superfamily II DNA or RNA helicase
MHMPETHPHPEFGDDTPTASDKRPAVGVLTDSEVLKLQQLSQLSYWSQIHQIPKDSGRTSPEITDEQKTAPPKRWQLLGDLRLYDWQQQAISAWQAAGNRGIIKVVTGAGKTMLALGVMERLQNHLCPNLRVVIVVPTVVLVDQWRDVFLSQSNLPPYAIATLGGSSHEGFHPDTRVLIAVINSAATKLPEAVRRAGIGDELLLVVDECHRAGAAERRRLFETQRAFTIGLSATPERDDRETDEVEFSDSSLPLEPRIAGDDVLFSELGPVVYEMNYAEAVNKGVLAPFVIEHYGLTLRQDERARYEKLSREITDLRRDLETRTRRGLALLRWCRSASGQKNSKARRFLSLTSERKLFLYRAEARILAVRQLIMEAFRSNERARIIIFHESIEDVMIIFDSLRQLGLPVVAEHSEFPDKLRSESIKLFRAGIAQIIVSAKSLIEGFNVPAADIGIIAAASGSVRQRIQTLGRLLRPDHTRTKKARLIVLYVTDTTDEMIYEKADWEAFIGAERNEYYKWPEVSACQPELVGVPPRRPPVRDVAVDAEGLVIGDEYPGVFEGAVYSIDTQGGITDETGSLQRPAPALQEKLDIWMRHGGRVAVTPTRHFLLKIERGTGDAKIIFLGVAPDPLFLVDNTPATTNDIDRAKMVAGDLYPFSAEGAKRLSVLQRDARLIARKERGNVKFIRGPEDILEPEKATSLRNIIAHLRDTYQSGKQISKVFVTLDGDVIYPYRGSYYFAGRAPEGKDGFLFE